MHTTAPANDSRGYTVVARRYRPQSFEQLVGQEHIAHALHAAIRSGRVGHAYLFTGARGVGKTSSARIFAKALNVPSDADPALAAEISQAIEAGEDMDVIEIDGASNRGIEEIRQLRANVHVRPSRAPYKIYIIDEVHMLTHQAFNALLKTLEEPPPHVKFIFCTTDPDKLPITVLSRCQRFDFVPIKLEAIQTRLAEICAAEGYQADESALALLARRAAGSMRDSQSLLEQVISFSAGHITVEQVQQLLGIADEGRLLELAQALADHDPLRCIQLAQQAAAQGADAGQLAEQLLNYLRDIMAVGIGGGPELLRLANPAGHGQLHTLAQSWGVQTVLSAIQILDEALVRMRSSVAASALLEVALVQICQLEQLASIPALLEALAETAGGHSGGASRATASGSAAAASRNPPGEKKNEPSLSEPPAGQAVAKKATAAAPARGDETRPGANPSAAARPAASDRSPAVPPATPPAAPPAAQATTPPTAPPAALSAEAVPQAGSRDALQQWRDALATIDGMLADYAGLAVEVIPNGSDQWTVVFPPGGTRPRELCEQSERRQTLEQAVQQVVQRAVRLSFSIKPGQPQPAVAASPPSNFRVQKLREVSEIPYVKKLCEVIGGEILRVDPPPANAAAQRVPSPHSQPVRG